MAAVTRVMPSFASPVGEHFIRRGEATEAIKRGQAVAIDGLPSSRRFEAAYSLAADTSSAVGLALKDAPQGEVVEVLLMGLMDGFSGLDAGTTLTVVDGELDDTAGSSRFYAYNDQTVLVGFYFEV